MICYWDKNREHATRHGISEDEIEFVLHHASPPYPEYIGGGKYRVLGFTEDGAYVQVIYVHKSPDEIDFEALSIEELLRLEAAKGPYAYPIHARELTHGERRRHRRRKR